MDNREKELLFELYELYVNGTAPKRSAFRIAHPVDDLDKLDRLVNMQYLDTRDDYYRVKPLRLLTLDHPLVESEKGIIDCLLPRLLELYLSNPESPMFTRQDVKLNNPKCDHLTEADVSRALLYLHELNVLEVYGKDSNGLAMSFTIREGVRKATSTEAIIPDWARPEDLAKAEMARHSDSKRNMLASLIGPQSDSLDFAWVKSKPLRDNALADWRESTNSFDRGFWKGAIIFAGSTIEGLLLAGIGQSRKPILREKVSKFLAEKSAKRKQPISLEDLHLRELIQLAKDMKLVSSGPHKFSHSVSDYRNLIHPGNLIRDPSLRADRPEAEAAASAVRMVARDIGEHLKSKPRKKSSRP